MEVASVEFGDKLHLVDTLCESSCNRRCSFSRGLNGSGLGFGFEKFTQKISLSV